VVKLYFARHGQTDWNRQGRTQGENDIPLNALGRRQARSLAEDLVDLPVEQIVCSSLQRARQSCELANQHLNWPVYYSEHWREFSVLQQADPDYQMIDKNIHSQFQQLLKQNKVTLLISHGAVFDCLCRSLAMPTAKLGNTCLLEIVKTQSTWQYQVLRSGYF